MKRKIGRNGSNKHLHDIKKPRIFFAHHYSDEGSLTLMKNQRRSGHLNFVDYSIPSSKKYDLFWKTGAKYRIKTVDAVAVLIGNSKLSNSILWEMKVAKKYSKPIIAIEIKREITKPQYIKNQKIKSVKWNCKKVQNEFDKTFKYRSKKHD